MAIVFDSRLEEGFDYIPVDQRGDAEPFSVKIKTIASRDLVKLQDNLLQRDNEDKISLRTGSYNLAACKLAIIGWSNMNDRDGKAIEPEFSRDGKVLDKSLDYLPTKYFDEIANVAISISNDPSMIDLFTEPKVTKTKK